MKITDIYLDIRECGASVRLVIRIGETAFSTFFTGSEDTSAVAEKLRKLAGLVESAK